MAGIVQTAYDTIEGLRRNLRDRYKDYRLPDFTSERADLGR